MLRGSEARGAGLALAPAFEMPQPSPQGQQPGVNLIGQSHSCHDIILLRCIFGTFRTPRRCLGSDTTSENGRRDRPLAEA
jgi:hypothetical protein